IGEPPRQTPSNRSAQIRKLSPTWQMYAPTDHVSSGSLSDPSASASASTWAYERGVFTTDLIASSWEMAQSKPHSWHGSPYRFSPQSLTVEVSRGTSFWHRPSCTSPARPFPF